MSDQKPVIVWFRQDLRIADNPALAWASSTARPLLLIYILEDADQQTWGAGSASKWWLYGSLEALGDEIARLGNQLVLRRGDPLDVIPELARTIGGSGVAWNRCYEPHAVGRDTALKQTLIDDGLEVHSFNSALWAEPWVVKNKAGQPFRVFTPFWKELRTVPLRRSTQRPARLPRLVTDIASEPVGDWGLRPVEPNWAEEFETVWRPGEAGAHIALDAFLAHGISGYASDRNLLRPMSTSRLSPHLHFGEISPVQVRERLEAAIAERPDLANDGDKFLSELAWREFSVNLLFHNPGLPEQNWRRQFDEFDWRTDPAGFAAWSRGRTGYPVVDAGMRQLWRTGFMHNRARMIAASFLIKDLLIDWRRGAKWFWDTLVDADLANNSSSWQWVAGSGADAAPYFRIFNPVTQGEQYDPDGSYVRKWVPELSTLPDAYIHCPWNADPATLRRAGIELGITYPHRIVDHALARDRAMAAFKSLPTADGSFGGS